MNPIFQAGNRLQARGRQNGIPQIVGPANQQIGFTAGENVMILLQKLIGPRFFKFFRSPA